MRTRTTASLLSATTLLAVTALTAAPALAEPPTGTVPGHTSIVAVGAQTDQDLFDGYQASYSGPRPLYSYDATGSATITPKVDCPEITRPNGASAGIALLSSSNSTRPDKNDYCVDFARSSRAPKSGDPAGLAWAQFAYDAADWAANAGGHAPASLSTVQLQAIFSCDASKLGAGASGPVTWKEVGGTSPNAVVPVVPPSTSGLRTTFLNFIGVSSPGACVQGTGSTIIEQNEGTDPIFSGPNAKDIVFPYSVGVFIAQNYRSGTASSSSGNLTVRAITQTDASGTSTVVRPIVVKSGVKQIAQVFPLDYSLYDVVRSTGEANGFIPTYLVKLLGKNNAAGYVCSADGQTAVADQGFLPMAKAKCGKVTAFT